MLVRVQGVFSATSEVLAPFTIGHYVAGFMRGSHIGPLMPVVKNSTVSYFDGPPVVSCLSFWIHKRRLTTPADAFDHPYRDWVRSRIAGKATEIRTQGFFGAAMLPYSELEYGGIVAKMYKLEKNFTVKKQV
ncbi:MAG TPA: fructose 1,6-bisphosphatase [Thermodesulfobacteriota bacterium]|nr:fructose 1,6-bisphosphatase [Thermodesulfobacteriota bacterium]